jgi:sulfonate transport system substrate-binding protein
MRAAGLLDNLPYKIEWSQFPAAANLHEALRADAVDIGGAADSPTVASIAAGSRIKVVGAWSNEGKGTSIIVPKDSPIRTAADLKGKRISPSTRGSVAHYLVLGALDKAGVDTKDVHLNFLSPSEATSAFASGSIDALGTWGVYAARARGQLGARVLTTGEGINSGLNVISATDTALADSRKRQAIKDFNDRLDRAYSWGRANPGAFDRWYAGFARQPLDIAAQVRPEETTYHRVAVDNALGDELQRTFDTWVKAGTLRGKRDLHQYIEPRLGNP